MAPINQIESTANGLPRSRARKPGVVKMPAPITFAMTIQVAKRGPAVRSRDVCRRSMDNVCRTGILQSLAANPSNSANAGHPRDPRNQRRLRCVRIVAVLFHSDRNIVESFKCAVAGNRTQDVDTRNLEARCRRRRQWFSGTRGVALRTKSHRPRTAVLDPSNRQSVRRAISFVRIPLRSRFGTPIVLRCCRQRNSVRQVHCLRTGARDQWRFVLRIVSGNGILHHDFIIDFPVRLEPPLRGVRLAADTQSPYNFSFQAPVLRYDYFEHIQVPARIKMRRLTAIITGIDTVLGPDGNIEFFLIVAVEIAEIQGERAVRVGSPTLVNWNHVLSTVILTLIRNLSSRPARRGQQDRTCQKEDQTSTHIID